jgi:hypothetical protein
MCILVDSEEVNVNHEYATIVNNVQESTPVSSSKTPPTTDSQLTSLLNQRSAVINARRSRNNHTTKTRDINITRRVETDEEWKQIGSITCKSIQGNSFMLSSDGDVLATTNSYNSIQVFQYNKLTNNWIPLGNSITESSTKYLFGFSISLSAKGDRIAIGSPGANSNKVNGYVSVFYYDEVDTLGWKQLGNTLKGTSLNSNDLYGVSVSLTASGDRLAVGASLDDTVFGIDTGSACVYDYNISTDTWDVVGERIDGGLEFMQSGTTVTISPNGKLVAIASKYFQSSTGQVQIYSYIDDNGHKSKKWTRVGESITGLSILDYFGSSVAMSYDGTRVAIGGPYYGTGKLTNAGHVQVFDYDPVLNSWVKVGSNDIIGLKSGDLLGSSVSLSYDGNILALGAVNYDSDILNNNGLIRIYEYKDSFKSWELIGQDIVGEKDSDQFGYAIFLSSGGGRVAAASSNSKSTNNDWTMRIFDFPSLDVRNGVYFTSMPSLSPTRTSSPTRSSQPTDIPVIIVPNADFSRKWPHRNMFIFSNVSILLGLCYTFL